MFDIFQKRNSEQIVFFEKKSDKEIICKINALKHFNVKEETFKDYLDGKITVKQMLGAQPWTNVSKLN